MAYSRELGTTKLVASLNGAPKYLGTIASTTVKTNADTAVPFTIPDGQVLLLQADAACHFLPTNSPQQAQPTVTSSNGLKLAADEKYVLVLVTGCTGIQVVGSANVKVWALE